MVGMEGSMFNSIHREREREGERERERERVANRLRELHEVAC